MCGRFTLSKPVRAVQDLFKLAEPPPELRPRYNIAPTQVIAVVGLKPDGKTRGLASLRWGLEPLTGPMRDFFTNWNLNLQAVIDQVSSEMADERDQLCQSLAGAPRPDAVHEVSSMCSRFVIRRLQEELDRVRKPPTNPDRDREIVRLRDDEGLSFGQIALRFGHLSPSGAEKAYKREKARQADGI